MSSALVTMREASGGRKVQHHVAHAARVVVLDGVLVLQNWPETEEYLAAHVELLDHIVRAADQT